MPGRPRVPLSKQKGHLTQEIQKQKELEEESIDVGNEQLQKAPKTLRDKVAKDEWKRIVKLYNKIKIIGNLDKANLLGYCNAYSIYIQSTEELEEQPLVVDTKENPLLGIQRRYADEMRKFGNLLGMSVTNRLKSATVKVNKQQAGIEGEFGDI